MPAVLWVNTQECTAGSHRRFGVSVLSFVLRRVHDDQTTFSPAVCKDLCPHPPETATCVLFLPS